MTEVKEFNPPTQDKRKKEYKEYKKNFDKAHEKDSKGLGDDIAKVTKATGIDKLVKWVLGEDCGCKERREEANREHPYRQFECPTEDQYNWMKEFFNSDKFIIYLKSERISAGPEEQEVIHGILNRCYLHNYTKPMCASCINGRVNQLKVLYDNYV